MLAHVFMLWSAAGITVKLSGVIAVSTRSDSWCDHTASIRAQQQDQ